VRRRGTAGWSGAARPDGSLYIADSQKGKIWRVMYKN